MSRQTNPSSTVSGARPSTTIRTRIDHIDEDGHVAVWGKSEDGDHATWIGQPPVDAPIDDVLILTLEQQPYSDDDVIWQAAATDEHGNYYRLEWDGVDIDADDDACCEWGRYRIALTWPA
jgi:hypothetical protein